MGRTVFGIRNTAGELIAEHVRIDLPTGGKRMYWRMPGSNGGSGLLGLTTPDLPLYRSERLPELGVGTPVVICEGERPTDALWFLGIAALGTVTGASSTPNEDALSVLLPFTVVLWPDYDREGYQHMNRIAHELARLGGYLPRTVRPDVWLPSGGHLHRLLPKGYDAADFVAAGGRHATAERLIRSAAPWHLAPMVSPRPDRPARPAYERRDDGRVEVARSSLLAVVEQKLGPPHRKMGRSVFWPCPFHADRTPSFKVDLAEPFFRCFGCEAKGDVFDFLRLMDGASFHDTLGSLAPSLAIGPMPRYWG